MPEISKQGIKLMLSSDRSRGAISLALLSLVEEASEEYTWIVDYYLATLLDNQHICDMVPYWYGQHDNAIIKMVVGKYKTLRHYSEVDGNNLPVLNQEYATKSNDCLECDIKVCNQFIIHADHYLEKKENTIFDDFYTSDIDLALSLINRELKAMSDELTARSVYYDLYTELSNTKVSEELTRQLNRKNLKLLDASVVSILFEQLDDYHKVHKIVDTINIKKDTTRLFKD